MNAKALFVCLFLGLPSITFAQQNAEAAFHLASNQYIHEKNREAVATLDAALQRYPNDEKLRALREKIKEEQKDKDQQNQEQNQDQKDQQKQDQEKKEQEQKEQEKKDDEQKEDQEKKEQQKEKEEQEKKEQEKNTQNLDREKLEQMKISEEKARMILEAMKNQEKQYLQQNKRKATKSRDRSKPDW